MTIFCGPLKLRIVARIPINVIKPTSVPVLYVSKTLLFVPVSSVSLPESYEREYLA